MTKFYECPFTCIYNRIVVNFPEITKNNFDTHMTYPIIIVFNDGTEKIVFRRFSDMDELKETL